MESETPTQAKKRSAPEPQKRTTKKPKAAKPETGNKPLLTEDTEHELPSPQAQEKEELAAYEKLRQEVKELLEDVRETASAETLKQAVDKAAEGLKQAGSYSANTLNKAAGVVKKDLTEAAAKIGPKWDALSDKGTDLFAAWRDRGSVFLGYAASAVGDWLHEAGGKLGHRTYSAGEVTYSGILTCAACGEQVVLRKPAHLEPCSKCRHTVFQRL